MYWSILRVVLVMGLLACAGAAQAQEAAETVAPEAEDAAGTIVEAEKAPEVTVWDMVSKGGVVLWVIGALSVVTAIMGVYFFLTITPSREVPANFMKRALSQIGAGDLRGTYQMCEGRDELLANVLRAGLRMHGHDRFVIQEAMESEGERGAAALWQKISYLNNVAVIAPLLGLLGTVLGMMRAFGSIALDDAQVKTLKMAYAVAQAMITTAAGLMLAIPAFVVYFYLRGRVTKIISQVEAQSAELVEALMRSHRT